MLRQPLRSLLLILLIAAASFSFVTRAVEYMLIRERIAEVSDFFRNVGILSHRDGLAVDISEAAELIADNRYVAFYERRRGFEGTLVDMYNVYIVGSRYWRANFFNEYHSNEFFAQEYINLLPRLGFAGFTSGDSYFYATVNGIRDNLVYAVVDKVVQGYPERLYEGQILRLRWDPGLEVGQRYFFKATFYWMLGDLQLDSRNTTKYLRWHLPSAPEFCPEMEFSRHVQSAVYLRTTKDMAQMPLAQESLDIMRLWEGRYIDMDDYLNARPVVVIQRRFAERRGVGLGDTISIRVNKDQHLIYSPYYLMGHYGQNPITQLITSFPDLGVLSTPGAYPYIILELEVVGIFDLFRRQLISTEWTSINKFMYIPDSLIPAEWNLNLSPAIWYSFVLDNPRNQAAFLWETRDSLAQMGLRASFMGRDGSAFWPVADTILMSSTINLVMFSIVSLLVLTLTVALFIWQRYKEYAILRSLGCPARNILEQSTVALAILAVPGVVAGSVAGWLYAGRLAEATMEGFSQIIEDNIGTHLHFREREAVLQYYVEAALPSSGWLVLFCVAILSVVLLLVLLGNIRSAKASVLEILQGAR